MKCDTIVCTVQVVLSLQRSTLEKMRSVIEMSGELLVSEITAVHLQSLGAPFSG